MGRAVGGASAGGTSNLVYDLGGGSERVLAAVNRVGRPLAAFKRGDRVRGAGGMALRKGYSYVLEAEPGNLKDEGFHTSATADGMLALSRFTRESFEPELTPAEMLMLGVFEGKYLNDCVSEFPAEWFLGALMTGSLSPAGADPMRCNYFGTKSRLPLSEWRRGGWVSRKGGHRGDDDRYGGVLADPAVNPDERGWFQWYCRYWMGRRLPEIDAIQIKRWRAFRRHAGAIRANCARGDLTCRPRERQALLQWAYNPFI
jgi:hypothetical protein